MMKRCCSAMQCIRRMQCGRAFTLALIEFWVGRWPIVKAHVQHRAGDFITTKLTFALDPSVAAGQPWLGDRKAGG
jgi:hypothetical protein